MLDGPEFFAAYAYPPNELGYCGPADPHGLLVRGTPAASAEIRRRARSFEGAWIYLELIASACGIADPLDTRVVEAYWVGNALLGEIDPQLFVTGLRSRLAGQLTGQWANGIPESAAGGVPHHAFHVFAVYPWTNLLSRGGDTARSILDNCRIRIGVVESVGDGVATVRTSRLDWDGSSLSNGSDVVIPARWGVEGHSFLDNVHVGDTVAVHWDWICSIVTPEQAVAVREYEDRQLAATNLQLALSSPG